MMPPTGQPFSTRSARPAVLFLLVLIAVGTVGYSIIEAASIDDAVALLADSPMDMWIYEAMPM